MMAEATESQTEPIDGNGKIVERSSTTEVSEAIVEITKLKALLADAQAKLAEITEVKGQALAAATKIDDHQTVVATKSAHIEDARLHGDKVITELDRELASAKQQATEAENQKTRAQTAADESVKTLADIQATKGTAESDSEEVAELLKAAEESAAKTKGLADVAATIDKRIEDYERKLAEMDQQGIDKLRMIEGLLPSATTVGLAHAFDERRRTFLPQRRKWENWFIGSVIALAVLAGVSFLERHFSTVPLTIEDTLLYWLFRLPVAGILAWLAIHSSHEAALAKQLEEDYGFKAVTASAFLGFNKQMGEVGSAAATNEPLAKLCADTLQTIANPPGRIYEKNKLTATVADQLSEALRRIKELTDKRP